MYLPDLVGEGEQPVAALVLNLTPVNPDASGWLWADYISPSAAAPTSAANYVARQSVSNSFVAPAESGGLDVSFANMSAGSTDLVVDVSGWFA